MLQGGCRAVLQGALFTGGLIQGSVRIFTGLRHYNHWTDVHAQRPECADQSTVQDASLVALWYSLSTLWRLSYVRLVTDKPAIFC
jgi:hypothetical protein